MKGWFRENGGPAFYGYSNRTSVTGDINMVAWCLVFLTLYVAFLIVFPGIRKQRFTTFVIVTLSLSIGNVIMVAKLGSSWHIGKTRISSTYCAFSKELITADLGVYIGLDHVNITLRAAPNSNSSVIADIDYNERFIWRGVHEMSERYQDALVRGLPFPILTVAEYFSLGVEGFRWGGEYRAAGYYSDKLLWAAFGSWLMMNLLLLVVPRYGAYAMILTASFLLASCFIYYCMLPVTPLVIRFEENKQLTFTFGWCFWLTLFTGVVSGIIGIVVTCIDIIYPHRFSTVLEVDFDTSYDRHIIIKESRYHRKKRSNKSNEEEGLGRKILRRLSSKKEENDGKTNRANGLENRGFEMDVPNSPWRYAYNRPTVKDISFRRTSSQDSASSIASSNAIVTFTQPNDRCMTIRDERSVPGVSNGDTRSRSVTLW